MGMTQEDPGDEAMRVSSFREWRTLVFLEFLSLSWVSPVEKRIENSLPDA